MFISLSNLRSFCSANLSHSSSGVYLFTSTTSLSLLAPSTPLYSTPPSFNLTPSILLIFPAKNCYFLTSFLLFLVSDFFLSRSDASNEEAIFNNSFFNYLKFQRLFGSIENTFFIKRLVINPVAFSLRYRWASLFLDSSTNCRIKSLGFPKSTNSMIPIHHTSTSSSLRRILLSMQSSHLIASTRISGG